MLNGKSFCWHRCCLWPPCCNKPRTLLSSPYIHLTECAKLLCKHLEENFKHLLGMELAADVIFLVLSSVKNDLCIYVFATGVGCEIRYVDSTELKDIPYISARATCVIKFSVKETSMLRLKIWMLSFLEESTYTYITQKDRFFDKEKIYLEDVNNQNEYFRRNGNICCMVFLNNMLMTSLHIIFNFLLDSIYNQGYPLHPN